MPDTSPMRPILFTITQRMGIVTLRDAVEWYKRVWLDTRPLGDLMGKELEYINTEWAEVCKQIAESQGVPAGILSYWLDSLASQEIALAKASQEEGESAQAYNNPERMPNDPLEPPGPQGSDYAG